MTSRYTNTRTESKNSILFATLSSIFGDKMNLARIKFFGLFICALCQVQTVCFEKLAVAFDADAKVDSSLRRIQHFMAEYMLDTRLIARFVFSLLPHKGSYRLTIYRTNWKFGSFNINILVLAVVYQGVAFPLLYKMMPKFGNFAICLPQKLKTNRAFQNFRLLPLSTNRIKQIHYTKNDGRLNLH